MASEQIHKEPQTLLAQAGIAVPAGRLPALTFAIAGTLAQMQALARHDYGLAEPASRFRVPR